MKIEINSTVVGEIENLKNDNFFIYGTFKANENYNQFKSLFDELEKTDEKLEESESIELEQKRDVLTSEIENLSIKVDNREVEDFTIMDGICEYKEKRNA